MVESGRSSPGTDVSVPNVARIYDYWLGGKDNFAADREAADRQARAVPQLPWLARQNREFLRHPAPVPRRRELEQAVKAFRRVPARTRAEIAGFFGDLTLVEPGLTDIWAWRPDGDTVPTTTTTDFMRILGGAARKN